MPPGDSVWASISDERLRERQPEPEGLVVVGAVATLAGYVRCDAPRLTSPFAHAMPSPASLQWVKCQDFGSELEASIAVAILDNAGIPAIIRSNDSVGLFGSAFQGYSAMGVSLMVPSSALSAARTVLANAPGETTETDDPGADDNGDAL